MPLFDDLWWDILQFFIDVEFPIFVELYGCR
jgi:hypothetical protein